MSSNDELESLRASLRKLREEHEERMTPPAFKPGKLLSASTELAKAAGDASETPIKFRGAYVDSFGRIDLSAGPSTEWSITTRRWLPGDPDPDGWVHFTFEFAGEPDHAARKGEAVIAPHLSQLTPFYKKKVEE